MHTYAADPEQAPEAPKRRKPIREQLKEANERIDVLEKAVLALEIAMDAVVHHLATDKMPPGISRVIIPN